MSTTPSQAPRSVVGHVALRRVGLLRFPTEELIGATGTIARLGRDGSIRVLFGRGRKVQLADGTEWRIKALESGPFITPVIMSPSAKIAGSGPLHARRSYGINLKDQSFTLIPLGRVGLRLPRHWALRRDEIDVATIDIATRTVDAEEPVPTAAVLMAFALLTHGIPGEDDLLPRRDRS
jgi:hypothetical protein